MQLPLLPAVCCVTHVYVVFTVWPRFFIIISTFLPPSYQVECVARPSHSVKAELQTATKLAQNDLIAMKHRTPAWFSAARFSCMLGLVKKREETIVFPREL